MQEHYRNSIGSDTELSKAYSGRHFISTPSLPLSTPPPSYHSIPQALEVAQINRDQCQPIYTARRESRPSISTQLSPIEELPTYSPPTPPPAYGSAAVWGDSGLCWPDPWPLPPCEGAQWLDCGTGPYSRAAVEIHNMYHFMVEDEGWISPLMTVSEEDEARRRRYRIIFDHDFYW